MKLMPAYKSARESIQAAEGAGFEAHCEVPDLVHYLDNNINISRAVLRYYYKEHSHLNTFMQIANAHTPAHLSKLPRKFIPYSNGAYAYKEADDFLHSRMQFAAEGDKLYAEYTPTLVSLALQWYSKGFQYGYDHFIEQQIATPDLLAYPESKQHRIFDYLVSNGLSADGFETSTSQQNTCELWWLYGIGVGYIYRAWAFVLENDKAFDGLFIKYETDRAMLANNPAGSRESIEEENVALGSSIEAGDETETSTVPENAVSKNAKAGSGSNQPEDNLVKSFKLIRAVNTKRAQVILQDNGFIDPVSPKDFQSIFSNQPTSARINWLKTVPLLARFIFELHKGNKEQNIPPACENIDAKFKIAAGLFYINNKKIDFKKLAGNNRKYSDKKSRQQLHDALRKLSIEKFTT